MTKKVLVITDAQNEFITGALGNKECEAAVKNIIDQTGYEVLSVKKEPYEKKGLFSAFRK